MKRNYAVFVFILMIVSAGASMFLAGAQTVNTVGALQFSPGSVKNNGSFTIRLSGADSIPASTVTRLFIDIDDGSGYSGFKDFGSWLTVGELRNGVSRTMNCSSYSSYSPSGSVNVTGKILSQRVYVSYEGVGSNSEVVTHTKDCSVPSTVGGVCSVAPTSANISANGVLDFTASSNQASVGGDYVYISTVGLPSGTYSDLGPGKIIPIGSQSLNFKVYASSNAKSANVEFKVYCARGCPYGGCPGGGSAEVLGYSSVNLNVSGSSSGGGGGSTSIGGCKLPNLVLPKNSSAVVKFGFPDAAAQITNGDIVLTGSSGSGISAQPVYRSISINNQRWMGDGNILVQTGADFSGGTYSVTSDIDGEKCTATGRVSLPEVSNASGKVKISQVKSLDALMFPDSECSAIGGTALIAGCRRGFYGGTGPRIINYMGLPALFGGDLMRSTYSKISPKVFTLNDPMNPVLARSGVTTNSDDSVKGEHGMTYAVGAGMSSDGKYSAVVTNYELFAVGAPGKPKTILDANYNRGIADIVNFGSSYFVLNTWEALNITDPTNTNLPTPSGFPNFSRYEFMGEKVVMGDGSYVAVSANDPSGHVKASNPGFSSDILLFSLNQAEPVAKLSIPSGHESMRFDSRSIVKIPFSGGDYIFTIGTSGANLFKFEYSNPKITWVIKDASYSDYAQKYGNIFGSNMSGFDVGGGNVGVVMFTNARVRAFLFSDISQGKWNDVLVGSPLTATNYDGVLSIYESPISGPVLSGGATYIYSGGTNGDSIKVWKFEAASASDTVSPGGPTTTSTVPTYDCGFDLSFAPTSLKVKQGTYYANYTVKANSASVNPFCTISIVPPTQSGIRSDFVSTLLVSPGGQVSMLLNVSKAAKGVYDLPVKAAARGVPMKTYTARLTVE